MPVCPVCGSVEFEILKGLSYCKECNTQVQAFYDEKEEEFSDVSVGSRLALRTSKKRERSDKSKSGKPWLTTEGFNIIIHKQVQSLITFGASPLLKNVVLQLWAAYLKKCEVCFQEGSGGNWTPALGLHTRDRDIKIICGEKALRRRKKKKKANMKRKKKCVKNQRKNDSNEGESNNPSDFSIESDVSLESCESENDFTFVPKSISSSKRSFLYRKRKRAEGAKKFQTKRHNVLINFPDYMTVSKTLCFSYLGLLLLEDQLLLSDIIRFAREGNFPYFNGVHYFPSTMKLNRADWTTMTPLAEPVMKTVATLSTKMATFIQLPKLKHRPLLPIAVRFIKDLNLPTSLILYVKLFISKNPMPEFWYPTKPHVFNCIAQYEVIAMAYIIVALKFLFVINDRSEKKHSAMVRKINELESGLCLFVWDEWISSTKLKAQFLNQLNISYSKIHDINDVESLALHFSSTLYKWSSKDHSQSSEKLCHTEFRNTMRSIFSNLVPRKNFQDEICTVSSFPLTSKTNKQLKLACSSRQFSSSQELNKDLFLKDFSSHSISYSLNGHSTILSCAAEEVRVKVETQLKKLELKFYHKKINSLEKNGKNENVENLKETIGSRNKYWYLNCTRGNVKKLNNSLPLSFKWLLNFTSQIIEGNSHELYYQIVQIEKKIFKFKN